MDVISSALLLWNSLAVGLRANAAADMQVPTYYKIRHASTDSQVPILHNLPVAQQIPMRVNQDKYSRILLWEIMLQCRSTEPHCLGLQLHSMNDQ